MQLSVFYGFQEPVFLFLELLDFLSRILVHLRRPFLNGTKKRVAALAGTGAPYPSVERAGIMPPRFLVDNLSEDELEQIRPRLSQHLPRWAFEHQTS